MRMFDNTIEKPTMPAQVLGRILIVDDDPDVLDAIKELFAIEDSYSIKAAANVTAAKNILESFKPDIALLDIRLGGDSGLDLLSHIKIESPETSCIMMTAHRDVKYAVKALRSGATEYMFKPVEPEYLLRCVDDLFIKNESEKKEKNKTLHLEKLALHDQLTGVANRSLLFEYMQKIISRAGREQKQFSVIFVDLDNFKKINDTYGHQAGDDLLIQVSQSLNGCIRDEDILARIGGDEFVVVLDTANNKMNTEVVVQRLLDSINDAAVKNGYKDIFSASIGISIYPKSGKTAEMLLCNADSAMYEVKNRGGSGFQYYKSEEGNEK